MGRVWNPFARSAAIQWSNHIRNTCLSSFRENERRNPELVFQCRRARSQRRACITGSVVACSAISSGIKAGLSASRSGAFISVSRCNDPFCPRVCPQYPLRLRPHPFRHHGRTGRVVSESGRDWKPAVRGRVGVFTGADTAAGAEAGGGVHFRACVRVSVTRSASCSVASPSVSRSSASCAAFRSVSITRQHSAKSSAVASIPDSLRSGISVVRR